MKLLMHSMKKPHLKPHPKATRIRLETKTHRANWWEIDVSSIEEVLTMSHELGCGIIVGHNPLWGRDELTVLDDYC